MLKFRNNAEAVLAQPLTDDSGDPGFGTIHVVDDGSADAFGWEGPQLATLINPAMPGLFEVVKIIERPGMTEFSVERGCEYPTSAASIQAWPVGTRLSARVTAGMLESFPQADEQGFLGFPRADRFSALGYPAIKRSFTQMLSSSTDYHRAGNAMTAVGASMYVDMGVPPAWGAGNYLHGDVVAPSTPDGCQYWVCTNQDSAVYMATEPAFEGADVNVPIDPSDPSAGYMVAMAMPINFKVRFQGVLLVVEEVGFIARTVNAADVPVVSIGSDKDSSSPSPTRYADNVALSQITADNHIHRIPVAAGGQLVDTLTFKAETAATGGQFSGRFYWRGFFVEPG